MTNEQSIFDYYQHGDIVAARPYADPLGVAAMLRRMPDKIRKQILEPLCGGCGQTIAAHVRRVVHDGAAFHPSCARTHQARAAASPVAAKALCTIEGIAVPHDAQCVIFTDDGSVDLYEEFRAGCFDASLARGCDLKLNHATRIAGRWTRVRSEAGALRFGFDLDDDAFNRQIKTDIGRGVIQHCSIGYRRESIRGHYRGHTFVIEDAELTEISLLRDRRPAWWGTSVRVR